MREFFVKEYDVPIPEGAPVLDLTQVELKHCIGVAKPKVEIFIDDVIPDGI